MSNKKNLSNMYQSINSERGVLDKLLPFLRSKKDTEEMSQYLNELIKYRSDIINDDTELDSIHNFHTSGIPGLNMVSDSFGGLKGNIHQASKLRGKLLNQDVQEINKSHKNLFSTKKERIDELKKNESQIDYYIKQAKNEYKMLKKIGGSEKELRKLAKEINTYKSTKDKQISAKLRGYGVSNFSDNIKKYEDMIKDNNKKISISNPAVADRLQAQNTRMQIKLDETKIKHTEQLANKSTSYDLTLRNSKAIVKDAFSKILSDPKVAFELLSDVMGTVVRGYPVVAAVAGYAIYSSYIAPLIFGKQGYHEGVAGFRAGSRVMGTNMKTGEREQVTVPEAKNGIFQSQASMTSLAYYKNTLERVGNKIGGLVMGGGSEEYQLKNNMLASNKGRTNKADIISDQDSQYLIDRLTKNRQVNTSNPYNASELLAYTQSESGFRNSATTPIYNKDHKLVGNAHGMFQFTDSTLKGLLKTYGSTLLKGKKLSDVQAMAHTTRGSADLMDMSNYNKSGNGIQLMLNLKGRGEGRIKRDDGSYKVYSGREEAMKVMMLANAAKAQAGATITDTMVGNVIIDKDSKPAPAFLPPIGVQPNVVSRLYSKLLNKEDVVQSPFSEPLKTKSNIIKPTMNKEDVVQSPFNKATIKPKVEKISKDTIESTSITHNRPSHITLNSDFDNKNKVESIDIPVPVEIKNNIMSNTNTGSVTATMNPAIPTTPKDRINKIGG